MNKPLSALIFTAATVFAAQGFAAGTGATNEVTPSQEANPAAQSANPEQAKHHKAKKPAHMAKKNQKTQNKETKKELAS